MSGQPEMIDGWIPFMGDRNPCAYEAIVDVKLRNGDVVTGMKAGECTWNLWNFKMGDGDIVAYREVSE